MKNILNKRIVLSAIALSVMASQAGAADWLSIAETEPSMIKVDGKKVKNVNTKPRFWGFIQAGYQQDFGTKVVGTDATKAKTYNKNLTPFVMLTPSLTSQAAWEINRARIAIRGMVDKDNTLNYFFMTEFGEDGITSPAGHITGNHLTDASISYTAIPYVNIRMGQFKYPGAEEGLRAVFASSYRNFTTATNQLLLERFLPNNATQTTGTDLYTAATETSVGAFRDRGAELFYTIPVADKMTVSYAGMVGSGTGLSSENATGNPTLYGYMAGEYLFGKGKGYGTQSFKVFAWYQDGDRLLNNHKYSRTRYGLGFNYFKSGLRVGAEWMKAKGMIYNGAKDTDNTTPYNSNWEYQIAAGSENEADGGYLNVEYFVLPKKVSAMVRYDYLNRLTNAKNTGGERDFKTTTLGLSYHFIGPTRIDVNYAFRTLDAPGNANAQKVTDNMGNLLSVQGTLKF
jgi:hypothetical protein